MKNIIVFDLDGTLSLVGDRLKYLEQTPKDWDSFYNNCKDDELNESIAHIYKCLWAMGNDIKIVTGRRESVREETLEWLDAYEREINSEDLTMRKDGDKRHDTVVKPELIEPFKDRIIAIFEDRNSMVKKWRDLGYVCLQVAEGDF
jgi:hypothetical protein